MEYVTFMVPYGAIVDMGKVWHLALPATDELSPESDAKFKWKVYARSVSATLLNRQQNAHTIICVNDVYGSPHFTKED